MFAGIKKNSLSKNFEYINENEFIKPKPTYEFINYNTESTYYREQAPYKAPDEPVWDPCRDVHVVEHYDIDWESGPIGRDAQAGDVVVYVGYDPLLISGGEYSVYFGHNDGTVDLVRTDNQNFTYGQSMVTVSNTSLYWRRGEYDY